MRRKPILASLLIAAATRASAGYWVDYEGSSGLFPEQSGWTRITHAGGAQRYFEDGALVLDGLGSIQITDSYWMSRPSALDPRPGEIFVARWRLRVDEVIGYGFGDPMVSINSDDAWAVVLLVDERGIESLLEPGLVAPFAAGAFHEFELRSPDMRSYELLIDDVPALAGAFHQEVSTSQVGWGDGVQGAGSLSHWSHFAFGVVPEPRGIAVLAPSGVLLLRGRLRGGRAA